MVAEQDSRVGTVAGVAEAAYPEGAAVHQVAQEDGPPLVGRVGLQSLEEPLQVAVDVADDQDRQRHSWRTTASDVPLSRRTALV